MTAHLILEKSYGSYRTYELSLENAMSIFEIFVENLPDEVSQIAQDTQNHYISNTDVVRSIVEILKADIGSELPKMQKLLYGYLKKDEVDNRPKVYKSEGMFTELAIYMVKNNLSQDIFERNDGKYIDHTTFVDDLSFFEPLKTRIAKPIKCVVYEDYLSMAYDYELIINKKWKDNAPVHKIVNRIFEFVNSNLVDSSDINFEVVPISKTYG